MILLTQPPIITQGDYNKRNQRLDKMICLRVLSASKNSDDINIKIKMKWKRFIWGEATHIIWNVERSTTGVFLLQESQRGFCNPNFVTLLSSLFFYFFLYGVGDHFPLVANVHITIFIAFSLVLSLWVSWNLIWNIWILVGSHKLRVINFSHLSTPREPLFFSLFSFKASNRKIYGVNKIGDAFRGQSFEKGVWNSIIQPDQTTLDISI